MTISSDANAGTDALEARIVAAIKKWVDALRADVDSLVAAGVPRDEWARLVYSEIAPHIGAEFIATTVNNLPPARKGRGGLVDRMRATDGLLAWPDGVEGPPTVSALLEQYPETFSGIAATQVVAVVAQPNWAQTFNKYMRETTNLVVGMADTAFSDMQAALAKAGQGAGLFEKQEAVREFLSWEEEGGYVGWMKRAERIARTETATARNTAAHQAALELADSGVPVAKRWVAARDERTRESHIAAHGQVVDIHDTFTVGDDRLDHPGDREHGSAREVINCRCVCSYLEYMTVEEAQEFGDELLADEGMDIMNDTIAAAGGVTAKAWEGQLAPLGEPTGDGRIFSPGGEYRFREFPLPLLWQESTGEGHDASRVVGTIDSGEITDAGFVARGTVFSDEEKVLALLDRGVIRPSVDLCDMVADVFADEEDPDGPGTLHVSSATVMAATLVAKPAFENVNVTLTGDETTVESEGLVASAVALQTYEATAFADPAFDGPTPVTVTDDGRVRGHLALWDSCHVGMPGRCVQPPRSNTGYASFHQSTVRTEDGPIAVGRLTVGGGHADPRAGFRAAAEHYDQTGATWAMVRAGEDEYGIWVAGQVHPEASAAQVNAGAEAPLSGDWRRIGGGMELVAALSVSTPGFPVRREYTTEDGGMGSLVAAAQVTSGYSPGGFLQPGQVSFNGVDVAELAQQVAVEMKREDRRDRFGKASAPFRQERRERVLRSARTVFGEEVK